MISGPISCVRSSSGPSTPSSYALAFHFSSHEFVFPFLILRACFPCRRTRCPLIWWDCQQPLILSLSLHQFAHPSIPSISLSIYPPIHSPTRPPTQAFRFLSTHPVLPLLSHSLLEATHLSICSIHPSSLTHPSV